MSDIIKFDFRGDKYLLGYKDSTLYVPLNTLCTHLTINYNHQLTKLKGMLGVVWAAVPIRGHRGATCIAHTSFDTWYSYLHLDAVVDTALLRKFNLYKTEFQAALEWHLAQLSLGKEKPPQQVLPISYSPFFVSGGQVTIPAEPAEVVSSDTAEQEVPASEASFDGILHPQKAEAAEPEELEPTIDAERVNVSASDVIKFYFHGDELDIVARDGKPLIAFKPACARIGVAYSPQLAKLKQEEWAAMMMIVTPTKSGAQEMVYVTLRTFVVWLAGLHPSKVKPELREKVTLYRKECADALEAYFSREQPSAQLSHALEIITLIREMRVEDRRSTERMFDRLAAAQERQERTVQAVFAMGTEVAAAFGKFSSAIAAMDNRMMTIERATVDTANCIKDVRVQTTEIHGRSNGKITPKEYEELKAAISYLASLYVQAHMYDWYEEEKRQGAARFDIQNEVMKNAKHAGRPLTSLPSMAGVEAMDWLAERTHKLEKRLEVQTSTVTRAPTHLPGVEDDLAVARRNAAAITGTAEKDDKKKE
jgi:hypothetical protein